MSCCGNEITEKMHKEEHASQCEHCGCDIDADGECIEMDNCSYSPETCAFCAYSPCDQSC